MEIKIFDVLGTIFIIYALLVTIEFLQNVVITILIFFFFFHFSLLIVVFLVILASTRLD